MSVAAGTQFTAYLADPGGDTAGVGARIEVPVTRQIVTAWVAGTLSGAQWSAVLDAPGTPGDYLIVWTTNQPSDPTPFPIFVPVTATLGPVAPTVGGEPDYPNVQPSDVMPALADVAAYEGTRLRDDSGTFYDTFTPQTYPTDAQVTVLIEKATDLILGQLRADFNPAFYPRIQDLIALQAAVLVEASYFRNQETTATSTYAVEITEGLTGIQNEIEVDRAQSVVFAGMEPRQPDWDTDPWLIYMGP